MSANESNSLDLTAVGQKLVGHSMSAEFTATRGLVVELFPFIFEASGRMSARAISRFLQEEQNIKLSQVTITRALNNPEKSWIAYFSNIETEAIIIAKWTKSKSFNYLFKKKVEFEQSFSFDDEGVIGGAVVRGALKLLRPDRAEALQVIRNKWFCIGLETRLKAQTYLAKYLRALEDKF